MDTIRPMTKEEERRALWKKREPSDPPAWREEPKHPEGGAMRRIVQDLRERGLDIKEEKLQEYLKKYGVTHF